MPELGDRVVVRYLLPDGRATDVIGILVSAADPLVVEQADGAAREVSRSAVVVLKTVPPRPVRNRELRTALRTLVPDDAEPEVISGWWCVTPAPGSGLPVCALPVQPEAGPDGLPALRAWFAERGLPPRLIGTARLTPWAAALPRLSVFRLPVGTDVEHDDWEFAVLGPA